MKKFILLILFSVSISFAQDYPFSANIKPSLPNTYDVGKWNAWFDSLFVRYGNFVKINSGAMTVTGKSTFDSIKVNNISEGYVPYQDAYKFVNSPIWTNGTNVAIGGYASDHVVDSSKVNTGETGIFPTYSVGQSFYGDGSILTSLTCKMGGNHVGINHVTGSGWAKLYAHSGVFGETSVPTGEPLATSTAINVGAIYDPTIDVNFTFPSPYVMVNGMAYVMVVSVDCGVSYAFHVHIRYGNRDTGTGTTFGNYSFTGATGWEFIHNRVLLFCVYGIPVPPKLYVNGNTFINGTLGLPNGDTLTGNAGFVAFNGGITLGTPLDTTYSESVSKIAGADGILITKNSKDYTVKLDTTFVITKWDTLSLSDRINTKVTRQDSLTVFSTPTQVKSLIHDTVDVYLNQAVKTTSSPDFINVTADTIKTGVLDIQEGSEPESSPDNVVRIFSIENCGFSVLESITPLGIRKRFFQDNVRVARNTSGASIATARAVHFTGSTGNKPNFALAQADSEATMPAIGMTTAAVANNGYGEIMILGKLTGVKTDYSGWTEGQQLYVDPSTAGGLTNVRPSHPNIAQWIGTIEVVHASNGTILVKTQALTGVESGTNRTKFTIGDALTDADTLGFDGTNDGSIIFNGTKFNFGDDTIKTTSVVQGSNIGNMAAKDTSFVPQIVKDSIAALREDIGTGGVFAGIWELDENGDIQPRVANTDLVGEIVFSRSAWWLSFDTYWKFDTNGDFAIKP
ncbi:MAG: hypothetical protein IMZ53_12910 [Thermoplasmata archaeon]|nr:hypothetical protein [Thermoplasmata archaeon]